MLKNLLDLLNEQQDEINSLKRELELITGAKLFSRRELERTVKEQQATIQSLQGDVNRLQYIIDELRKDNYKRFEKINELKAKLKEKQEDEKLYAQEILELNKTKKEMLNFKQLGGDY